MAWAPEKKDGYNEPQPCPFPCGEGNHIFIYVSVENKEMCVTISPGGEGERHLWTDPKLVFKNWEKHLKRGLPFAEILSLSPSPLAGEGRGEGNLPFKPRKTGVKIAQ
jgi:hypothetical protein